MENDTRYEKRILLNESYDDYLVKDAFILHSPEIFGCQLKRNDINDIEAKYGIDLISVDNPSFGVEVERGGAVYDHWADIFYSDRLECGFKTLNMPDRKCYLWQLIYRRYDFERKFYIDKTEVINPGYGINKFGRSDYFFNQFNVVDSEIITDIEKTLKKRHKVNNNSLIEGWVYWAEQFVRKYNKINGVITLQTDDPATHLPIITEEYRYYLQDLKEKEKNAWKKERLIELRKLGTI